MLVMTCYCYRNCSSRDINALKSWIPHLLSVHLLLSITLLIPIPLLLAHYFKSIQHQYVFSLHPSHWSYR